MKKLDNNSKFTNQKKIEESYKNVQTVEQKFYCKKSKN